MFDSDDETFDFDEDSHYLKESRSTNASTSSLDTHFWEIPYAVHEDSYLLERFAEETKKVNALLMVDEDLATRLLRVCEWQVDSAVENYLSDPDCWTEKCGLSVDQFPTASIGDSVECCICFDKFSLTLNFFCNHFVCSSCLQQYFEECLRNGTNITSAQFIKCPAYQCKYFYSDHFLFSCISKNTDLVNLAQQRIIHYYVSCHKSNLRVCVGPDCHNIIEILDRVPSFNPKYPLMPAVECTCGFKFCFECGSAPHLPMPCALLELWIKKCEKDSADFSWLSKNTKCCPKCKVAVEKNAGCNHMTCSRCSCQYCWVCLGDWADHSDNFSCHIFKKTKEETKNTEKSIEFYMFYYNRYINHQKAAKYQNTTLRDSLTNARNTYQSVTGLSWFNFEWIFESIDVLVDARNVLQNTYAFVYYLEHNTLSELFENNLKDVEMAVEELSEMLERKLSAENSVEMRPFAIDKLVYIKHRTNTLVSCTLKDLNEDNWKFSI